MDPDATVAGPKLLVNRGEPRNAVGKRTVGAIRPLGLHDIDRVKLPDRRWRLRQANRNLFGHEDFSTAHERQLALAEFYLDLPVMEETPVNDRRLDVANSPVLSDRGLHLQPVALVLLDDEHHPPEHILEVGELRKRLGQETIFCGILQALVIRKKSSVVI